MRTGRGVILGFAQGGMSSGAMAQPLLVEAACRARVVTSEEMRTIRRAWSAIVVCAAVNPVVLPQRSEMDELLAAVPELGFQQPRGVMRVVIQTGTSVPKKGFGDELAEKIGTVSRSPGELETIWTVMKVNLLKNDPSLYGR